MAFGVDESERVVAVWGSGSSSSNDRTKSCETVIGMGETAVEKNSSSRSVPRECSREAMLYAVGKICDREYIWLAKSHFSPGCAPWLGGVGGQNILEVPWLLRRNCEPDVLSGVAMLIRAALIVFASLQDEGTWKVAGLYTKLSRVLDAASGLQHVLQDLIKNKSGCAHCKKQYEKCD